LGEIAAEHMKKNALAMALDLNRMGITSYIDMGGRGFRDKYLEPFRALARENNLGVRTFYYTWHEPENAEQVDAVIAKIRQMKPFQGNDWLDHVGYGETVFFPLHDNLLAASANPSPQALAQWRRIADAVAEQ